MRFPDWVRAVGTPAVSICAELGVPWQVCWAQARLESGAGGNELARSHNYWGVKPRFRRDGTSITGHTHVVRKATVEYDAEGNRRVLGEDEPGAEFCGWDTVEQGVRGWCAFVTRDRYAGAAVLADDPLRWVAYVVAMGYATLPPGRYVRRFLKRLLSLRRALERMGLTQVAIGLGEPNLDLGLVRSLAALDGALLGAERRAVARFELQTELRRLPFEEVAFEDMEVGG